MILKVILFAVIAFAVYKLLGGKFPKLGGNKNAQVPKGDDAKKIQEDTLVECDKCGTFVTYKESIIIKGKVYCSKECTEL